jgi:hypothetical protein
VFDGPTNNPHRLEFLRRNLGTNTGNQLSKFVQRQCNVSASGKCFPLKVFAVAEENPRSELARLREEQRQARQDEVYGGFSESERAEYDTRAERIFELDAQLMTMTSADEAAAEQRRDWNKKSETDTPQSEGRQPYGTRELDSTNAFTDSLKTSRTEKKPNPDDGRE